MTSNRRAPIFSLFQSTLPAWGETKKKVFPMGKLQISIHSPRMGRDTTSETDCPRKTISIHSPRMGRDPRNSILAGKLCNFNPLSPHGERPRLFAAKIPWILFQSTLPAWGETGYYYVDYACMAISIHSPRMGRDKNEG